MGRRKLTQADIESDAEFISDDGLDTEDESPINSNTYKQGSGRPNQPQFSFNDTYNSRIDSLESSDEEDRPRFRARNPPARSQPPPLQHSQSQPVEGQTTSGTSEPINYNYLYLIPPRNNSSNPSLPQGNGQPYPAQSQYAHSNPSVNSYQSWNYAQSTPPSSQEEWPKHTVSITLKNTGRDAIQYRYREDGVTKSGIVMGGQILEQPTQFIMNTNYFIELRSGRFDKSTNRVFTYQDDLDLAPFFQ